MWSIFLLLFLLLPSEVWSGGILLHQMWHPPATEQQMKGVLYGNSKLPTALLEYGIKLDELPYIYEHVLQSFFSKSYDNIFDTQRTNKCLENKRILVLGDSVLEEMVMDFTVLLSGIGRDEVQLDNFVHSVGAKTPKHPVAQLPNGIMIYAHR